MFLKLFLDPVNVRPRKIHFVEGDHNLHVRRSLGMINRFDRLRHNAVVGCNNEGNNVCHVRAARAHCRKSRVPGRINESDFCSIMLDAVRADVLRDPAGFSSCDAGLANHVQ